MNITYAQVIAFLGLSKEKGDELLKELSQKYPDGAATVDQILAIAAPHVTPAHIAKRLADGFIEGWNTLRAGKGPAKLNPTAHFV